MRSTTKTKIKAILTMSILAATIGLMVVGALDYKNQKAIKNSEPTYYKIIVISCPIGDKNCKLGYQ